MSSSAVIEVYVHTLDQLFNSMDPSPFRDKSLDREAEDFILTAARELDQDAPITLVIQLDAPPAIPDDVDAIRIAIGRHFARRSQMARSELRQLLRRGRKSLFIGLSFLALSVIGGDLVVRLMTPGPLALVLRESLVIGGWVAMWGPIEIFLYEWWPIRDQRRLYDRLSSLDVRILRRDEDDQNLLGGGTSEAREVGRCSTSPVAASAASADETIHTRTDRHPSPLDGGLHESARA